jgi:hypothetical protein
MVEHDWGEKKILEMVLNELNQSTSAPEQKRFEVGDRLVEEAKRICQESQRIQASGEIHTWMMNLAKHRLQQCLKYYKLGSRNGRVELHSTLSAIVYRYITPPQIQSSYQARLNLIEDFLQAFYVESLNAFRREANVTDNFSPQGLLELAEYMAFTERYGKRRITLSGGRIQQLIILRAQTFSQQQPPETLVDIEKAAEGSSLDGSHSENDGSIHQVRQAMVTPDSEGSEDSLRQKVIQELISYLEERQQKECADYFALRLQDLPTQEIEAILGLTPRERDYLQQRFRYHLMRFALSHRWELVHEWLDADLDRNLGLTPAEWEEFQETIEPHQRELLRLKQQGLPNSEIARSLSCTVNQVNKRWFKLLNLAWEIRNRSSGKS